MKPRERPCVHVATAAPRVDPSLRALLSARERRQVQSMSLGSRAASSTTAHALARLMIHELFAVPVSDVQVEYPTDNSMSQRFRKPRYKVSAGRWLDVSIAHTSSRILVAVGEAARVGVDLESSMQHLPLGWERWALAPAERAVAAGLAGGVRTQSLITTWTQKEAIVKCIGTGFTTLSPTDSVDELLDRAPSLSAQVPGDSGRQVLRLQALEVGSGYIASLATFSTHLPRLVYCDGDGDLTRHSGYP